jgi:hypothetical protein
MHSLAPVDFACRGPASRRCCTWGCPWTAMSLAEAGQWSLSQYSWLFNFQPLRLPSVAPVSSSRSPPLDLRPDYALYLVIIVLFALLKFSYARYLHSNAIPFIIEQRNTLIIDNKWYLLKHKQTRTAVFTTGNFPKESLWIFSFGHSMTSNNFNAILKLSLLLQSSIHT